MKVARATLPSDAFPTPLDCSYLYLPLRGYPLSIYQSVPENRTLAILRAIFPVIPYKITKSVNITFKCIMHKPPPCSREITIPLIPGINQYRSDIQIHCSPLHFEI